MLLEKNEAIIRPRSHHTMQRKSEDRVFPYNSQTWLVHLKQIIWYYYKCIVSKQFSIININHRRHGYHISCRHTSSTIKTAISRIGNWISVMSRGKGQAPLLFRDTLANASGLHTLGNPWMLQGRSSLMFDDWQFLNTRFPVLTDQ